MIDESNPAGRLHKILLLAKRQPDKKTVKEVWVTVLEVEQSDIAVTRSVVELYQLSSEIKTLIKMNSNLNHDLYLASFNKLEKALLPLNLAAQWQGVKVHLSEEALTRLQFCADELSKFYAEESLSDDDLLDIEKKTEELFESAFNSSLAPALRLAILEEVERLRHAIKMYKIKGAKGLKEALQATVGAVVVNQEEFRIAGEVNRDVIQRLGELIDKLDSFTARALKIKKMLSKPIRYILEKITDPDKADSSLIDSSADA